MLTITQETNILPSMGRKKKYKAPQGLIRKPGSPYWWINVRVGSKHVYSSTKYTDLDQARLVLVEVQRMLLTEELRAKEILGKSIPFPRLIERYLKDISPNKRSRGSDKVNSKNPIKFFGEKRIDTVTAQDIYQYQDWRKSQISERKKRPVSGATVNREVSLISDALTKAIKWGYVSSNPCREVERFSESRRHRYITDQEFNAIRGIALERKESKHLANIMDCLYLTAQRVGRVLDLKWSQVDLKQRTITLEQTSENKGVPSVLWIGQDLLALFDRLRNQRSLFKVVGPFVFQKSDGSRYGSIKKTWNSCCMKARVKDARIHDIRHRAITDMINSGWTTAQVGKVAGHSNTSTTDGYTHLMVGATKGPLESLRIVQK